MLHRAAPAIHPHPSPFPILVPFTPQTPPGEPAADVPLQKGPGAIARWGGPEGVVEEPVAALERIERAGRGGGTRAGGEVMCEFG